MTKPCNDRCHVKKIVATVCLCALVMAGCSRETPPARRFEIHGEIVGVDKLGHMLILKHHTIPGYMQAMTMGFEVKDDWVFDVAKPGDQVQATLVVQGGRSWLEGLVIAEEPKRDANLPPTGALRTPGPGEAVPAFTLVDQDGRKINLQQYRGKTLLLTFIYTRCPLPDYCPLMSKNFAAIAGKLPDDATLRDSVRLLSISIDPEYDKPAVLRRYAQEYVGRNSEALKRWQLASGTPQEVRKIAEFFGLSYWKDSGQIIHALVTAVVDPQGKVYKVYRGNDWHPTDVLDDIGEMRDSRPPSS
jgi:protein SCO1/2